MNTTPTSDTRVIDLTVAQLQTWLDLTKPAPQKRVLNREQVATMFNISLVALNDWMKTGEIPFHKIKSRVFFLEHEIFEALEKK